MTARRCGAGEVVFGKGDPAKEMYYAVTGRYRLTEVDADVESRQMIGEIGFVAPDKRRSLTLACVEGRQLLTISYNQFGQLYFQNPAFGSYFLQLIAERLFKVINRLETVQAPPPRGHFPDSRLR